MLRIALPATFALVLGVAILPVAFAAGDHEGGHAAEPVMEMSVDEMRDMHSSHEHGHDFEAMEALSPDELQRLMSTMMNIGLAVPPMDARRGREIFVSTGCVVCHQVNGVGGEIGPSLNAVDMPSPMNMFEFAARMWRGAGAMILMQEDLFGDQIEISGQDLADLVAFAHDAAEQEKLTAADIPEEFLALIDG